jgi:hypothetical protein
VVCQISFAMLFIVCLIYRQHSMLLYEGDMKGKTEVPYNLPSLGSLVGPSAASCPVLHERSTVHFVLALLRLMWTLGKLNRSTVETVCRITFNRSLHLFLVLFHCTVFQFQSFLFGWASTRHSRLWSKSNNFAAYELSDVPHVVSGLSPFMVRSFSIQYVYYVRFCLAVHTLS